MARRQSGVLTDDFLELFNPSASPVDLSGVFLTDNPMTAPIRHELVPLTFIGAYGYLLLIADGNTDAGANHTDFALRAEQGLIGLFDADVHLIDSVYYGPQMPNISMGRSPNGSTNRSRSACPPRARQSRPSGPAHPGGHQRSPRQERLAADYDGVTRDWIELYNASASTVNLADLSLSDDALLPRRWVFPAGVTLAAGAYRVIHSWRMSPPRPTTRRA